jgi:prepilin-type N-terminal cleavage/methylation domain-containing protein
MQRIDRSSFSNTRSSAGFTLVELAVCLCIIGILTSSGLFGVSEYFAVQRTRETRQKIDFVMNALSTYAQTHDRLPCPADPNAAAAQAGQEGDNGKCFVTGGDATLYRKAEGIVPWKELAIPQNMAVDAWGRYITYKPAPALTVDTQSAAMQDMAGTEPLDVHNACRSAQWYDADGKHVNRAKALFCCNEPPTKDYLSGAGQPVALDDAWRKWGVMDAATAASIEPAAGGSLPDTAAVQMTNNWSDREQDPAFNGSFSIPHYMDGPAAPLMRATGLAVVLISHGNDGVFLPEQERSPEKIGAALPSSQKNGVWPPQMFAAVLGNSQTLGGANDIVSWQRSDQLFARVGSGSCEYPSAAVLPSYSCKPQIFSGGGAGTSVKDPDSGQVLRGPPLYNVQMGLTGNKYQLRVSLTKSSDSGHYDDSLGFYEIGNDGTIQNVQVLVTSVKGWAKDETRDLRVAVDNKVMGIGFFIIPDGFTLNDGYKDIDLTHLKFISGYALYDEKNASITDQLPPILVSVDPVSGFKKAITGSGQVSAYHLYSNLNPGHASHVLRPESICHIAGEKVGVNGDIVCARPTAVTEAKADASDPGFAQIGFTDSANINCYEYQDGSCKAHDSRTENEILSDGEGGFIASIGNNAYDDVAFSMGFSACPQGP